jgi:hypothetical protein
MGGWVPTIQLHFNGGISTMYPFSRCVWGGVEMGMGNTFCVQVVNTYIVIAPSPSPWHLEVNIIRVFPI